MIWCKNICYFRSLITFNTRPPNPAYKTKTKTKLNIANEQKTIYAYHTLNDVLMHLTQQILHIAV